MTHSRWQFSLQKRIPLFVGGGLLIVLSTFAAVSLQAVDESRQQALHERLQMAQLAARHVDLELGEALGLLSKLASLPELAPDNRDAGSKDEALARAFDQLGKFSYSLFLLDHEGQLVASAPHNHRVILREHLPGQRQITQTISTGLATVSGLQCSEAAQRPIVCLTVPLHDAAGRVSGLLGGSLELTDASISGFIASLQLGKTGYAQVVDQEGLVLVGTGAEAAAIDAHSPRFAALIAEQRSLVTPCHSCHDTGGTREIRQDVIAFAPLTNAPWGVTINQSEEEVFAPAVRLQQQAIVLSSAFVLLAVITAWYSVRSVVRPIAVLTEAAEGIASGDLATSIPVRGDDEIGRLSRAFETMRLRLRDSLEQIRGWNKELEQAVARRTRELEESRYAINRLYLELQAKEKAREHLLRKVISAQEEERRRIARELHDETSQALTALSVGLETAGGDPQADAETIRRRIASLKPLVLRTLDEVHNLIFDLRPSCLDDLGLTAAIQWYADTRLARLGISFHLHVEGTERRLAMEVETALFRVVQEALTNVIKHAEAETVAIRIRFGADGVRLRIADDGRGFCPQPVLAGNGQRQAYGLLGMRERVDLLGGELQITSSPGSGTSIDIDIPSEAGVYAGGSAGAPH